MRNPKAKLSISWQANKHGNLIEKQEKCY